ncbi:hypothetical protein KRX57_09025 [Weeksellaceae bacterium TAE3-ERU29]|nr:hypothetical protein [Weeksellaceae bacterium TAE3-ERU29]
MKIQNFLMIGLMFILLATSCDKDEYNNRINLIPIEERNQIDDKAIVKYLEEHYFDEDGKTTKFSETSKDDDGNTPLIDLAKKDESGFWYVKRPGVETPGITVTNNNQDKILLQYELQSFEANRGAEDKINFTPVTILSTINTTGSPEWDPVFYYVDTNKGYNEIKGFIDGIKYFNATNREVDAIPAVNFQGLIIIPSRLAYGRTPSRILQGYDQCVVVNFELYKVENRETGK